MAFSDDDDKVVWKDWAEAEIAKRDRQIEAMTEGTKLLAAQVSSVLKGLCPRCMSKSIAELLAWAGKER